MAQIVVTLLLGLGREVLLGNMTYNIMCMATPRLRLEDERGEAECDKNA
jgi:hypothetical protein